MRLGFIGGAAVYAVVTILLAASLPVRVPLGFGTDLVADRWTGRGAFVLGVCGLGGAVIGLFAGLAARYRRLRRPLQQLGAVTLTFLAVELALGYGRLGGYVAGADFPDTESVLAGVPLSRWVAVVAVGYLAYLLGWLARTAVRRPRATSGPRRDSAHRGTADSGR